MKEYYKWSLFSPLWLPVLIGLIALVTEGLLGGADTFLPDWLIFIGGLIGFSLLYGGIQYAIALWIVWTRIDFERAGSWIVGVLWLPIIFTIIQVLSMAVLFGAWFNRFDDLRILLLLGGIDLALGYGYVAIWLLGFALIRVFQKNRKVVVV